MSAVKKWKKKTWINADILYEDVFYARTPDTENKFPPTINATYKIIGESTSRSTLEELPIEPLPEEKTQKNTNPNVDKTFENEVTKNEETTQATTTVVVNEPTEV
tara:strand:+ start:12 stop:326 length:315 start_codon:yes stop_codon:yes gene_type:complete